MPTKRVNLANRVIDSPERDLIATMIHSAIVDARRWCPPLRHDANVWLRRGDTEPPGSRWAMESLGLSYDAVMARITLTEPTFADWRKWRGMTPDARYKQTDQRATIEIIRVGDLTGAGAGTILGGS